MLRKLKKKKTHREQKYQSSAEIRNTFSSVFSLPILYQVRTFHQRKPRDPPPPLGRWQDFRLESFLMAWRATSCRSRDHVHWEKSRNIRICSVTAIDHRWRTFSRSSVPDISIIMFSSHRHPQRFEKRKCFQWWGVFSASFLREMLRL